jgi:hypothetical protein
VGWEKREVCRTEGDIEANFQAAGLRHPVRFNPMKSGFMVKYFHPIKILRIFMGTPIKSGLKECGQVSWSNTGQKLVKRWSEVGQMLVKIGEFPGFWGFLEGKKG